MDSDGIRLGRILEQMTGQLAPCGSDNIALEALARSSSLLGSELGLGFSQFNELLLHLGYDRVARAFFQFLIDGTSDYGGGCIKPMQRLEEGVERFRKLALLRYGNVKFGFKSLAREPDELAQLIPRPIPAAKYERRHNIALDIKPIPRNETYYLGYLVKNRIDEGIREGSEGAREEEKKRLRIVEQGIHNQDAYLCFDHMDVYIATSMREPHEYALANLWTHQIVSSEEIKELKVRVFDPTQAYCHDRIDKGLAEALMLKRAQCTVYFAQESDTLGKDSELASTLAQGKPVIAYIPRGGVDYAKQLRELILELNPSADIRQSLMHQLMLFQHDLAWKDEGIRRWLNDLDSTSETEILDKLAEVTERQYNRRAETIRNSHPLGIQVYLATGVANGVLVVRSVADCAKIIRRVLLNELEFRVEEKHVDGKTYILLIESVSNSVFRVMTGDAKLTNCFWNFYLSETA